ncbi:hypothetical protein SK128_014530, partial [Halocaridina rubra]
TTAAEKEILDMIRTTALATSIKLNEFSKPVTIKASRTEFLEFSKTQTTEKRKLQYINTAESPLHYAVSLQYGNAVNMSNKSSLFAEFPNFSTTPRPTTLQNYYVTPKPIQLIRDVTHQWTRNTPASYAIRNIEGRPQPHPSIYKRKFPDDSSVTTSYISKILMGVTVPLTPSWQSISPTSFSENIVYETTLDLPIASTMLEVSLQYNDFESNVDLPIESTIYESSLQYDDWENSVYQEDYIYQSFLDISEESSVLNLTFPSILWSSEMALMQNDEQSSSITELENTPVITAENIHDIHSERSKISYILTPSQVLKTFHSQSTITNVKLSPSLKNDRLTKNISQKENSTTEYIRNKIYSYFSSFASYVQQQLNGSTSQDQNASISAKDEIKSPDNSTQQRSNNYLSEQVPYSTPTSAYSTKEDSYISVKLNSLGISENKTSLISILIPEVNNSKDNSLLGTTGIEFSTSEYDGTLSNKVLDFISAKYDIPSNKEKGFNSNNSFNISKGRSLASNVSILIHKPNKSSSDNEKYGQTYLPSIHQILVETKKPIYAEDNKLVVQDRKDVAESNKSHGKTWLLYVGGAIALQIQLIIGLILIWCCLQRRFKRHTDNESATSIYDGFSKVVNFRNSEKLADEGERGSLHEKDNSADDSTSKETQEIPKCLTTSL